MGGGRALMGRMDGIVTLKERKAAAVERERQALAALRRLCWRPMRARMVAGFCCSVRRRAARLRRDSDVDILTDFPEHRDRGAWNFAERACWDRGLDPDVMPRAWCKR